MPRAFRLLIEFIKCFTAGSAALCVLVVIFGAISACAPTKPAVVTPRIVTQTVTKYVQVPDELTAPCPIEQPKLRTVAEAVRVAKARKDALEQCNRQLGEIRGLGK